MKAREPPALFLFPSSSISPFSDAVAANHVPHLRHSTMLLRSDITLRRFTTTQFHSQFSHPTPTKPSSLYLTALRKMATEESNNSDVQLEAGNPIPNPNPNPNPTSINIGKGAKDEDKKSIAIPPPPPPEKPLPGDCCGSGCVRCVWDIYYEELEEYNQLYNPDSKNS